MENCNKKAQKPKIRIFQTAQENLSILGVDPNLAMPKRHARMFISLLILVLNIILILIHVYREVRTFMELTQSITVCSANTIVIFILITLASKSIELSKTINDCECLLNVSKWEFWIPSLQPIVRKLDSNMHWNEFCEDYSYQRHLVVALRF